MTGTRTGMTGGAKGMVERVNIGKDGEKPIGKTRGRTVEREREGRVKNEERRMKGSPGENRMNKRK